MFFEDGEDKWHAQAVADDNGFGSEKVFVLLKDLQPVIKILAFGSGKLRDEHGVAEFFEFGFEPGKPVFLRIAADAVDDEDVGHEDGGYAKVYSKYG